MNKDVDQLKGKEGWQVAIDRQETSTLRYQCTGVIAQVHEAFGGVSGIQLKNYKTSLDAERGVAHDPTMCMPIMAHEIIGWSKQ